MGNEMGNNNTSGLKEEDNTCEDHKLPLQEDVHADDVKGENQTSPTAKGKDVVGKAADLASTDTTLFASDETVIELQKDPLEENALADDVNEENIITAAEGNNVQEKAAELISDEPINVEDSCRVREETEVRQSEQTPQAAIESVEAVAENSEIQSANLFKDVEDCEKQTEPCLEENLPVTSDPRIDKEASTKQEEERTRYSTLDVKGKSKDRKPQVALDVHSKQSELYSLNSELSVQDNSGSLQVDEHIHESSFICVNDDSSNLLDSNISKDLAGSNFSNTSPFVENHRNGLLGKESEGQEKMSCSEKVLDGDGDDLGNVLEDISEVTSDSPLSFVKKCNDDSFPEVNCNAKTSLALLPDNALDRQRDEFGNGKGVIPELTTGSPRSIDNKCNGGLSTEVNCIGDNSLASLPHITLLDSPLSSHQEVSDSEEKSLVLDNETKLVVIVSETENVQEYNPAQNCEEPIKQPDIDLDNASKYEYSTVGSDGENNDKGNLVDTSNVFDISKENQFEEANFLENGYQVDICFDNQSKASEGQALVVPAPEMLPILEESSVVDCRYKEGEEAMKKIVEEVKGEIEASYPTDQQDEQCNNDVVTTDQEESLILETPVSLLQSYDYQEGNVMPSQHLEGTNMSIPDLKQENLGTEFFGIENCALDSTDLTSPAIDLVVDKAFESDEQDPSQHVQSTSSNIAESKASAVNLSTESCLSSAFVNGGYEAVESLTRLSTESNPDNLSIPTQIQKSPSFNLDLRIEARPEESDRIPLLYQDKTANESLSNPTDFSLVNLQHEAMAEEEKSVTLERSYSEKSKIPFLGFLKEEEEANMALNHQKQENSVKEVASDPAKGKVKRKARSFLFSNCICCGTMIN
ncbi:dentin sialophosphoprotein-like [Quillaja saponaria]|uniref:Dentin sialophosphoprotein-like n=1 Tax=Quillaja saponaria TaxID=32244 RepID=A0AAD7LB38_QUISA|nr:dentin sialophosphoprotein-like [Quillaja saponaria]